MSVVKSLAGAMPPSQFVAVPHKVVPAVELQSIRVASDAGGAMDRTTGRITRLKSLKTQPKTGMERPVIERPNDFTPLN